jgi:hypothetical protein
MYTTAKNSLEDDLSAFYADMGDFAGETNDIFAVPKI